MGKGVYKLLDFVHDSLPEKDISQLRVFNRRSFGIYDKYIQLRYVYKELSDHIKQFILGISSKDYAPLKELIFKGVEKGIEDCQVKYRAC